MRVLLLSNGAPGYYRYFNNLICLFRDSGDEISVAVDSEFSKDQNELNKLNCEVFEFSSFFSRHVTDHSLLNKYSEYNLNAALLSDYERAEIYRISGVRGGDYYDRLKSALLSFFEKVIFDGKVDLVLYEGVSNAFAHFAYFVCLKYGVCYKGLMASRLPGRFAVTDDPKNESEKINKILVDILSGKIAVDEGTRSYCVEYLDNIENITPDYMSFNRLDRVDVLSRYFNFDKIKKIFKIFKHLCDDHLHSFQIGNPLNHSFQMVRRNVCRKLKVSRVAGYYREADLNKIYYLYPLHFHPEASTSLLAGAYLNEYEVIRNIAFNLPEGTVLYVKDHLSAFAFPDLDFYKKIFSLPNVKLLAPSAPTKKLIKHAKAILTLTSTVGYEALLLSKRVYLFGNVFYEFHPNVTRIENPKNIFETLKKDLHCDLDVGRDYNLSFLAAYYMYTKKGRLNLMAGKEEAAESAAKTYLELIS